MIRLPLSTPFSDIRAVQRLVRTGTNICPALKKLFKKSKKMQRGFDIVWSDPNCTHSETCGCRLTLVGKTAELKDVSFKSSSPTIDGQYQDVIAQMNTFLTMRGSPSDAQIEDAYLVSSLSSNTCVQLIDPPYHSRPDWPDPIVSYPLLPAVRRYIAKADHKFLAMKFPWLRLSFSDVCDKLWDYGVDVPSLKSLCLRQFSAYHAAFGKTNGRPHFVSSADKLYEDHKLVNTLLIMQRPLLGDRPLPPFDYTKDIVRHFYRMSGIDYKRKEKFPLTGKWLYPSYLGSSSGLYNGESWSISTDYANVDVRPKGKKIDVFDQDLGAILEYIRTGKEPSVYFSNTVKNEYQFSFTKQWDDEKWRKFEQKLRIFVIPSSIYVLLERMISNPCHRRERGKLIRVGHKWGYGGADTLAQLLAVFNTPWAKCLVAGDFDKFDQSVIAPFVDLYWSTLLAYHDETDEDFPIIKEICKYLCKQQLYRITRLIGDRWAVVHGQVPSGQLNTSHMDSKIMAFYFISFAIHTIRNASEEYREDLELYFIDIVKLIVYGDDHVYNKGMHEKWSGFFSGAAFSQFCKTYYNCDIRDLEDGVSFLSVTKDGYLVIRGVTFLRHQFVVNPYYMNPNYPGQCQFLPFRETREVMIRAVYAREVKTREPLDILLSIVSHAYGTYGANKDAYDRLLILYNTIFIGEGFDRGLLESELFRRASTREMSKIRQMGLTPEELSRGFPSWDTIIKKNTYDPVYQDISQEHNATGDYDYEYDDDYDY